ncbi:LolA family protein [Paeniglutamicibacter cryotolerans]|uniref:Outer membrane lipoprotein-sorting protein n=1 Tax=Paeniglutamicibacter cryotolerans TaxID=670079 RepID=A0A839QJ40_9MICC|nr:DUF2092 domain-containing protein [Paeniglutamicibacter cryotolerans]MBB2995623.1 outer membrane lipoprotein-sorting protein [Paeniglutamicibacter cryotolerans]
MKLSASRKWIPAVAVPVLIGTVVLGSSLAAKAEPTLPPKSAAELLAMVANNDVRAFSGQLSASTDLGLPQLPDTGALGSNKQGMSEQGHSSPATASVSAILGLLSGTHQARVYVDGPAKARLQVFNGMNERNLIRNGSSLWSYDSANRTATHAILPASAGHHAPDASSMPTPDELAKTLLAKIEPGTDVSVGTASTIAGRDAYELTLSPKTGSSLVAEVQIGIDAQTGMALNVTVDAVGQSDPAISLGFTSFTPQAPNASLFDFTPPPGATVREQKLPTPPATNHPATGVKDRQSMAKKPTAAPNFVKGHGWDAVVVIPAKDVPAQLSGNKELSMLATPVSGGKLLHTSLFNVLIRDDGSVAAGMVPLEVLQSAAGTR